MPPSEHWNEVIAGRVRRLWPDASPDVPLLECPAERTIGTPSYAMNSRLAGADLRALESPASVATVFDSRPGRNLSGGPERLPPEPRHSGGDMIGCADGRVKVFRRGSDPVRWSP
jgi:hypothetical protein